MRIAQIAPLFETVPPTAYGGTERVIAGLCNELTRAGHEVTLFAAGGSSTDAQLVEVVPHPLRSAMTRQQMIEVSPHLHLRMLTEVFASGEFDVIHAHTDIWTLPFLERSTTPVVMTMHGRLDIDTVLQVLPLYPGAPLVSISNAQRRPTDGMGLNWAGTVYNGLDLSEYTVDRPRDYLAFVGRIAAEKRPDWAVEVARRVGLPLRVAAKIDPLDTDYWDQRIKPLFEANDVDFVGEISESEKPEFYGGAIATLFPIDWPEPFGLVMIESMAAGTPVLALDRGSVPEVIEHGVSGLISTDLDAMVRSVADLERLDPRRCRASAQRFSAKAMSRRYVSVYRKVLADARPTALNVAIRRPSSRTASA